MSEPSTERRFVEPPLGVRVVTTTLVLTAGSVLAGSGIGFLVALGLWLTLEEGFPDIWSDLDLDPISRTGLGVTSLVAAIAAVVFALASSADRLLLGRKLVRDSIDAPLDVPPAAVRRAVSTVTRSCRSSSSAASSLASRSASPPSTSSSGRRRTPPSSARSCSESPCSSPGASSS